MRRRAADRQQPDRRPDDDNPAAVAAATRQGTEADLIDVDDNPATPPNGLFIPNTATDAGLSARSNAWFTFFGQFFDHGLDLVTKGGSGTVFIPLQPDDPLYRDPAGPDLILGTADDIHTNFMVLTRATNQPGPDGVLGTADDIHEHTNTTTPFVDQNQTYTSHPSHQVFLREYAMTCGGPSRSATGNLLDAPDAVGGGLATWVDVKAQAAEPARHHPARTPTSSTCRWSRPTSTASSPPARTAVPS